MSVTRKWSLMAAVVALAILAAGWFLLVAPKRSEAADLKSQTASQERQNETLVQQLEVLKAQQAELPQQRAKLATMRQQVPDNPELPSLVRSLTAAGRKVGVSIDTMAPALPVPVVAPVAAVPVAPTTTDSTSTDTAATDTAATDPAAAVTATTPAPAPAAAPSLFQVPLNLKVTGSYFELEQFVHKLEGLQRSFLVTGFKLGEATTDASSASGGGTTEGDLLLDLQGRVFLAPPAAAAAATQPTAAPVASGQ